MLANVLGPDGIIVIVVLAIVLIFGGSKLPSLARGLGSAATEFKKGVAEGDPAADKKDQIEKNNQFVGDGSH